MRASIDQLVDKLERQIGRYRTRARDRRRRAARANAPSPDTIAAMTDDEPQIVKTKQFSLSPPMNAEESVLQLELVGHDFFVFRNVESGDVNVVYRRRDGGYGLIEPQ